MFDFFYVNKIETNLAIQSNSLHVKQKTAPLGRKEPKPPTQLPLLPPPPQPLSVTTAFLPMNVLFRMPGRESLGNELTPTPPSYPKCFLIKIKAMESMLKVSVIANYLHKKEKVLSKNLSLLFLSVGLRPVPNYFNVALEVD